MNKKNEIFIIAEAGVNHNGSIETAVKMIEVAAKSGVNAVKFQTFKTEKLASVYAKKANYQTKNTGEGNQVSMLKKLELSYEQHNILLETCKKNNVEFMSTPYDCESMDFLVNSGMQTLKIPSGEITNLPYLENAGKSGLKIILSTGMSDLQEVEQAFNILLSEGTPKEKITVLHATSAYPAPFTEVNLMAMQTIQKVFDVEVGYSDHTNGIEIAIAAAALGAQVIEKHFTLSRKQAGPDHLASIEPNELTQLVKSIRNVEKSIGNGVKAPTQSELEVRKIARKSIVAAKPIEKGEIFTKENITVKRPGTGISPMKYYEILGTKSLKNYNTDDLI